MDIIYKATKRLQNIIIFKVAICVSRGKSVTGLLISPPRKTGPLTHNIMFRMNSFLLQGKKRTRLNV